MTMLDLIPIKKSHITFYNNFPLYYYSKDGEPLLYKNADKKLDGAILDRNQYPEFFISKEDESSIVKQLMSVLNIKLARAISSKGISAVKQCICQILEEALNGPFKDSLISLPETIEILLFDGKKKPELLMALTSMNSNSSRIIEHSINVLALTAQYCFYKNYSDNDLKRFCLCALLHDIGTSHIDKKILETDEVLTEEEFKILKTHTIIGYKDIKSLSVFDDSIAITALDHHELLDGTGYPNGKKKLSFEAQVIGLIDSYEPLKYRGKTFRQALEPFNALQIIKKDVMQGKYNKTVFVDLCSCLIK
jgi:HD-GYP domain-containing protein (c-di-GMP phosphodiesterase class II)